MPVHKSGSGYQWGNHGKVYHGANARSKAAAQGRAAYAHGYRGKGHARAHGEAMKGHKGK